MSIPTAAMLVIGDEVLSGRTRDSNGWHLAKVLSELGIRLREMRVVGDEAPAIIAAVNELRARYTHVFTSGGIGPTHDDITADAVAAAFGTSIDVREDARAILAAYYGAEELNESRLRMARIPAGARLIDNPVSRAPGFTLGNVHVMAGVPSVFMAMVESLRPQLTGGVPLRSYSIISTAAEGVIAAPLGALAAAMPDVSFGSYPFARAGRVGTTLVARCTDDARLALAADGLRALLAAAGAEVMNEG